MYHFIPKRPSQNLILSNKYFISEQIGQYLKNFQIEAIRFLLENFEQNQPCILNDESGLGKTASVAVFLGTIFPLGRKQKCLIIVKDDEHTFNWKFHLDVLGKIRSKILDNNFDVDSEDILITKWNILKANINKINEYKYDYIVVDNRGDMLSNKFCTSMLQNYLKNKISLVIFSQDATIDLYCLYTLLQIIGKLEANIGSFEDFEEKYTVTNVNLVDRQAHLEVLEQYFTKREMLINFCRKFRLRRYQHEYTEQFPLVKKDEYKIFLDNWKIYSMNRRISYNDDTNTNAPISPNDNETEDLFECYVEVNYNNNTFIHNSPDSVVMSPLIFESDTDSRDEFELPAHQKTPEIISASETNFELNQTKRQTKMIREISKLNIDCKSNVIKPKNSKRGANVPVTRSAVQNHKCKKFDGNLETIVKRKTKKLKRNQNEKINSNKKKNDNFKMPMSEDVSMEPNQDVQISQNGQRLSETLNSSNVQSLGPKTFNLTLNTPLELDKTPINSSTDVESVKPTQDDVIEISSSSSSTYNHKSQNNRKRLSRSKPLRNTQRANVSNKKNKINSPSPDLFSTCEDRNIEPSQNESTAFKGFKIFGSEVNITNVSTNSCLELLEKQQKKGVQEKKKSPKRPITGDCEDDMFEITRNNSFGNILHVNGNDEVSPLKSKSTIVRKNKITKYFIGTQTETSSDTETVYPKTPKQQKTMTSHNRKSPKGNLSSVKPNSKTVSNNLTKWLIKNKQSEDDSTRKTKGTSKRRLDL